MPLTAKVVENAKPKEKDYKLSDEPVKASKTVAAS